MSKKYIKVHKDDFIDMVLKLGFQPHPLMSPFLHVPKTVMIRKTKRVNAK